jgi:hypothetical protein
MALVLGAGGLEEEAGDGGAGDARIGAALDSARLL